MGLRGDNLVCALAPRRAATDFYQKIILDLLQLNSICSESGLLLFIFFA